MTLDVRFRPMPVWPHATTKSRRSSHTFKATWASTLKILEHELRHLRATDVIIGCGLRDQDIRIDGWPRANAAQPAHPGVEISFATPVSSGRLVYATDVCALWQHNVRSIALGLADLRAVDLHIGSQRGQQYAGYRQLEASTAETDIERGRRLYGQHGSAKAALAATHPDSPGGSHEDFVAVQAYLDSLGVGA